LSIAPILTSLVVPWWTESAQERTAHKSHFIDLIPRKPGEFVQKDGRRIGCQVKDDQIARKDRPVGSMLMQIHFTLVVPG
jgi:hypothetical protein